MNMGIYSVSVAAAIPFSVGLERIYRCIVDMMLWRQAQVVLDTCTIGMVDTCTYNT